LCITDLNSTNGTVVNGQELGPLDNIEVEVGAEVIFGECLFCAARRWQVLLGAGAWQHVQQGTAAVSPRGLQTSLASTNKSVVENIWEYRAI
jgi:hypothetical protein